MIKKTGSSGIYVEVINPLFLMPLFKNKTSKHIDLAVEFSDPNKVEHRLFCYISKNWQGQPLIDVETVVNLIGSTTTEKGLSVTRRVDENHYEPGKKITEEQKDNLNIEFLGPNKKWNYIIRPNV
jgi:hypothetical protein